MEAKTDPLIYRPATLDTMTVTLLETNRRPIGFAAWPEAPTKKKKRKKK